jgi:arylsulfatase A-like enzyme/Tfp pilus assembly protein PilF
MARRERKPDANKQEKKAATEPEPAAGSDGRSYRRFALVALAGTVALAAIAAGIFFLARRFVPSPHRPLNVVLVTADTLRADHLPAYGYKRLSTPSIDRLASGGAVFEQASTVVPLTMPSHSSMFTGTFPMYHGVRDNGGYYLDSSAVTLAETLKEHGYDTGGFVSAFVLDSRWGINQGFDRYFDDFDLNKFEKIALDTVQRPGGETLKEALGWMEGVKKDHFFAWIHFYDIHTPYDPPEPFLSRYRGYPGARYDGEIAYVDSLVGQLLDWLDANDLTDDTLVIFIGDHGESLGQHEETTHGFFVYDATMHVPFILRAPYRQIRRGLRVPAQVRTIDLMPTILDLLGFPSPKTVQGTSLVPLLEGSSKDLGLIAYGESFYPRHHYGWSALKSVRNGTFHFIDAPRPELFDVATDPNESNNLAGQRAGTVQQLKGALDDLVARYSAVGIDDKGPQTLDPDTQAQLAALGYLGGASKVKVDPDRPLADPKDKIALFNLIKDAGADSSDDRVDEAMAKIDRVLAQDPGILEAHYIRGNLFTKKHELDKALDAYQQALARDPEYTPALFGLALTYKDLGRPEDAEAGFRRLIEIDSRDNRAYYMLAKIHAEKNDFGPALEILQQAVDIGSERAPLHNLMAECYIGLKRLDEAQKEVDAAIGMNAELPTVYFNQALIYEGKGDIPAAVEAYQKEIKQSPKDFKSYFNLAKLYGQMGKPILMKEHLQKAIESNDKFAIGHLYLAKFYLDAGDLDHARELAQKGIDLGPEPSMAPLGHFILADVYNREGKYADAQRELKTAQKLKGS